MFSNTDLKSYALLKGINSKDVACISSMLEPQRFAEGSYLFRQGDQASRLYLIQNGAVEVLSDISSDTQVRLAVRKEGDSIGEVGVINSVVRTASVRALEPVSVLTLTQANLEHIHQNNKDLFILIILNIAREVSRKLASEDGVVSSSLFGRS